MRAKIESIIQGRTTPNPILGYHTPLSSVHIDGWTWILFSSKGYFSKKQAQSKIDEVDADPSSSIGEPRVIVSWNPPHRRTSKYYVYYRWKRDKN